MPYNISYSDSSNKSDITVYDNTPNNETSLTYPGRNFTGYGQVIAENFLHLLENFASSTEPVNPIEGQLWYDSSDNNKYLKLWDGTNWQAASNITKSLTAPSLDASKAGELWIDLTNQQLNIFNGFRWVLVGPSVSSKDGKSYGLVIEYIKDTDGITRPISVLYLADVPVIIFSKDTFTPNPIIGGFGQLTSGINLNTDSDLTKFDGGFKPQVTGTASIASALTVNGYTVPANNFMRSDIVSSTDHSINIRNNSGITIGSESDFSIFYTTEAAKLYNSVYRSGIDLQVKNNAGVIKTVMRIKGDEAGERVGINNLTPKQALDVTGNILVSGTLNVGSNSEVSIKTPGGLESGSIKTSTLSVIGLATISNDLLPAENETSTIGRKGTNTGISQKRLKAIHVKSVYADEILTAAGSPHALGVSNNLTVDTLTVGGLTTVNGNIIPDSVNPIELGVSSKPWNSVYTKKIYATNVTVGGTTPLDVTGDANVSGKLSITAAVGAVALDVVQGKISKGLITNQPSKDTVLQTDEVLLYSSGDYLNKTTVAKLLASVQPPSGSSVGLSSRSIIHQTVTINAGATVPLTLTGYKGYVLYNVRTDSNVGGAWVRIYSSKQARTNDASRLQTVDPSTPGVIAEVITSANATVAITPGVIGFNDELTPTTDIELAVTNTNATTGVFTIYLTLVQLES
jgi:hypothetical protein